MRHVFLSHKTEEKPIALRVKDYLAQRFISAWIDAEEMHGGSKVHGSILDGIDISRYFVSFISYQYVRSDWCMRELEEAERQAGADKVVIIPVLLNAIEDLKLDELPPERKNLVNAILDPIVQIRYDQGHPDESAEKIAKAIAKHQKICFKPVQLKHVGGEEIQLVQFEIEGHLPTDLLRRWAFVEQDFVAYNEDQSKPLRAGKAVALNGKGPNWLSVHLAIHFKNLCTVYIFNNISNEYICVYDKGGEPSSRLGTTLNAELK